MNVSLGSASPIKRDAVKKALPNCELQLHHIESGVPPQPVGKAQTEEGAKNRCAGAKARAVGPVDLCIGIENGMWEEKGVMVDGAAIVIDDGRNVTVIWSDVLPIPAGHPGGPNGEWSLLKDPHSVLTQGQRPRAAFLADALSKWAKERDITNV